MKQKMTYRGFTGLLFEESGHIFHQRGGDAYSATWRQIKPIVQSISTGWICQASNLDRETASDYRKQLLREGEASWEAFQEAVRRHEI